MLERKGNRRMLDEHITHCPGISCCLASCQVQCRGLLTFLQRRKQHVKGNLGFEIIVAVDLKFIARLRIKTIGMSRCLRIDI